MSSAATGAGKEKLKIFETIFKSPGMEDKCKVVLQLSRVGIVLVSQILENGLRSDQEDTANIIHQLSQDQLEELKAIPSEMLKRGNLTEFYERLKAL